MPDSPSNGNDKVALLNVLTDRPIAYHPILAETCGGIGCALFLSQMLYWHGKQRDKDGWIFKTAEDFGRETGMTRDEQRTARKRLKAIGVLEEKLCGVPPTLHFRLHIDTLTERLANWETTKLNWEIPTIGIHAALGGTKSRKTAPTPIVGISQIELGNPSNSIESEITPESTPYRIDARTREGNETTDDETASPSSESEPEPVPQISRARTERTESAPLVNLEGTQTVCETHTEPDPDPPRPAAAPPQVSYAKRLWDDWQSRKPEPDRRVFGLTHTVGVGRESGTITAVNALEAEGIPFEVLAAALADALGSFSINDDLLKKPIGRFNFFHEWFTNAADRHRKASRDVSASFADAKNGNGRARLKSILAEFPKDPIPSVESVARRCWEVGLDKELEDVDTRRWFVESSIRRFHSTDDPARLTDGLWERIERLRVNEERKSCND